VYLFAKDSFTFKQSLQSIIKIPILWFALLALLFNYNNFEINLQIDNALEMGAYATIVLQLIIFGIYLAKINIKEQDYKLTFLTSSAKLILLPVIGIVFSLVFALDTYAASILIMSLATPLAVNNVNNAALFNCKPYAVTNIVLFSTVVFLLLFYFDLQIIRTFFSF